MRWMLAVLSLLVFLSNAYAEGQVVFCRIGDVQPDAWGLLKRYLSGKGLAVTTYDGTNSIEKHIEITNRINRGKASLFIAMDFSIGEKETVLVAVSNARRGQGTIHPIDEVPAVHIVSSREAAGSIASAFGTKVQELPLFPLLGVDMPGVFMRIESTQERTEAALDALYNGLELYFKRGTRNEK